MRRHSLLGAVLVVIILAAGVGWVAGRHIHSPGDIASKSAAPTPSPILVPVEKRALASTVVVRGKVHYGAPLSVVLATSSLKKSASIVSTAPVKGAQLREGDMAMAVSGRPVFVLTGATPMHRDLGPGTSGTDVAQLEAALQRLGFDPGPVDGIYDGQTAAAVTSWYTRAGWAPFGPTDEQMVTLRAAQADDFTARSELLKEQEGLATAQAALDKARRAAAVQPAVDDALAAAVKRDRLLATADVANKSAALDAAVDNERVANMRLGEARTAASAPAPAAGAAATAPVVPTPADIAALEAATRQASRTVATAQSDLAAAQAALAAANAAVPSGSGNGPLDRSAANADVTHAGDAVTLAQSRVDLFASRVAASPLAQVATKLGVQVPADELLFFPSLPLRVDGTKAVVGEQLSGAPMTLTNSRLAIDTALSLDDTKLVKTGASVVVTEPELGIKANGSVTLVADTPGTNGADPQRFYVEVTPTDAPPSLVGASVVLTITVSSTEGQVLTVPVAALSVGADGASRLQVQASDKSTHFVNVTPGLTANGLVAVTATTASELHSGDLVVVGSDSGLVRATSATTFDTSATTSSSATTTTTSAATTATTRTGA
jgi:peptidoglycan hydrolase-like protein with peptidoglycan-binding domain